ncbi:MAG: isoprenylcysteine carboxylmethyltransferase family protein [Anaerolineales bacterium]|jgi:protein-S-isoprenylcysteine O-methyltransferase Ste14
MPTTYFLIALLLGLILHFVVPVGYFIPQPWNLVGLVPLALGVWLNLSADRSFKQAKTTVKPFEESAALVTTGAFRYTRNPMYLGFTVILLGEAILLRSLTPFIAVVAFPILVYQVFIKAEERKLAEKFGDEWGRYQTNVRRWI